MIGGMVLEMKSGIWTGNMNEISNMVRKYK
jgi:hypothetical protein